MDISKWYEECIAHNLQQSGLDVERNPLIDRQKPDLRVIPVDGPDFLVECRVKSKDPEHARELREHGRHIHDTDAIKKLLSRSRGPLMRERDGKAPKYREIAEKYEYGYVVALYDDDCYAYPPEPGSKAFALAFSAHDLYLTFDRSRRVIGKGWKFTENQNKGMFSYPHVSGLLYSIWPREHYYLPNRFASIPVSPDLFPFACVPPRAPLLNGEPVWEQRAPLTHDTYVLPPNIWWAQKDRLIDVLKKEIISEVELR